MNSRDLLATYANHKEVAWVRQAASAYRSFPACELPDDHLMTTQMVGHGRGQKRRGL